MCWVEQVSDTSLLLPPLPAPQVLKQKTAALLQSADCFSASFDEVSNKEKQFLGTTVYVLSNSWELEAIFLELTLLEARATAANLLDVVLGQLSRVGGLDLSRLTHNLVGLCTDSASVMVGVDNGVTTRLVRENAPFALRRSCFAHDTSLSAGSMKESDIMTLLQEVMHGLYNHVAHSPLRHRDLRAEQVLIGTPLLNVPRDVVTRWLSKTKPAHFLWDQLPAIIAYLTRATQDDQRRELGYQAARVLYDQVTDVRLLVGLALMLPLLRRLNTLVKSQQASGQFVLELTGVYREAMASLRNNYLSADAFSAQAFPEMHSIVDGSLTWLQFRPVDLPDGLPDERDVHADGASCYVCKGFGSTRHDGAAARRGERGKGPMTLCSTCNESGCHQRCFPRGDSPPAHEEEWFCPSCVAAAAELEGGTTDLLAAYQAKEAAAQEQYRELCVYIPEKDSRPKLQEPLQFTPQGRRQKAQDVSGRSTVAVTPERLAYTVSELKAKVQEDVRAVLSDMAERNPDDDVMENTAIYYADYWTRDSLNLRADFDERVTWLANHYGTPKMGCELRGEASYLSLRALISPTPQGQGGLASGGGAVDQQSRVPSRLARLIQDAAPPSAGHQGGARHCCGAGYGREAGRRLLGPFSHLQVVEAVGAEEGGLRSIPRAREARQGGVYSRRHQCPQ